MKRISQFECASKVKAIEPGPLKQLPKSGDKMKKRGHM